MIKAVFQNPGLTTNYYIVKVSYSNGEETCVGLNEVVQTKLSQLQLVALARSYVKNNYIVEVSTSHTKIPSGYSETFITDTFLSHCRRIRFIETKTVLVPKTVFVEEVHTKEL